MYRNISPFLVSYLCGSKTVLLLKRARPHSPAIFGSPHNILVPTLGGARAPASPPMVDGDGKTLLAESSLFITVSTRI